jgi:hypothetical protein
VPDFIEQRFPPGPAVDADGKFAFVNIDYGGDLFAVGADIRLLNPLVSSFQEPRDIFFSPVSQSQFRESTIIPPR